jgi:hypothetical protein
MFKRIVGLITGLGLLMIGLPLLASAAPSVSLIKTFDYPAPGASTTPFGINNLNNMVGIVTFPSGLTTGFQVNSNSTITEISDPLGDGSNTEAFGISDSGMIDGIYKNGATQGLRGFRLKNGSFADYNGAPLCSNGVACPSYLFGINNAGQVAGEWFPSPSSPEQAFATIGGVFTSLTIPRSTNGSAAYGLSNKYNYIAGISIDAGDQVHGFLWHLTAARTMDDPAYPETLLFGVNNQQVMTGRVVDNMGVGHGVALASGSWVTYDYPGAVFTTLLAVNDEDIATGAYIDNAGISHGFLVRISLS